MITGLQPGQPHDRQHMCCLPAATADNFTIFEGTSEMRGVMIAARSPGSTCGIAAVADQVKPTSSMKCPSLRLSAPPPAQCTIIASRMMATMTTTNQKKNTMMLGMAYPATVLDLATAVSYPLPPDLCGSSKRQQPHRPQVPAIARHQPSDLPEWPPLTVLPLVHTEAIRSSQTPNRQTAQREF
jgi:hypothetical protein